MGAAGRLILPVAKAGTVGVAPVEGYELREALCGDCDADSRVFSDGTSLPADI